MSYPVGGALQAGQILSERHVMDTGDGDVQLVQRKQPVDVVVGKVLPGQVENLLTVDRWKPRNALHDPGDVVERIARKSVPQSNTAVIELSGPTR